MQIAHFFSLLIAITVAAYSDSTDLDSNGQSYLESIIISNKKLYKEVVLEFL